MQNKKDTGKKVEILQLKDEDGQKETLEGGGARWEGKKETKLEEKEKEGRKVGKSEERMKQIRQTHGT